MNLSKALAKKIVNELFSIDDDNWTPIFIILMNWATMMGGKRW
jgi:hypothetical protein